LRRLKQIIVGLILGMSFATVIGLIDIILQMMTHNIVKFGKL